MNSTTQDQSQAALAEALEARVLAESIALATYKGSQEQVCHNGTTSYRNRFTADGFTLFLQTYPDSKAFYLWILTGDSISSWASASDRKMEAGAVVEKIHATYETACCPQVRA